MAKRKCNFATNGWGRRLVLQSDSLENLSKARNLLLAVGYIRCDVPSTPENQDVTGDSVEDALVRMFNSVFSLEDTVCVNWIGKNQTCKTEYMARKRK